MALRTGTHTIADLAANTFASTLVQEFGIENLNDAIQNDLEVHNQRTEEMLSELANVSEERSTAYGTSAETEMVSADEFTRAPTQKIPTGGKVEFPLDKMQYAIGWTAEYLKHASVRDMARQTIAARQAHLKRLQFEIKTALFNPTNYTWVDRLVDNNSLGVKRLVNADSAAIPSGPNGESFNAATHTHYDAYDWDADYAPADRADAISALIQDVIEHGHSNDVRVYINRAEEADFRSLPRFVGLIYPNTIPAPGGTSDRGVGVLDTTRADNRLIGYFEGFPVRTKPWIPADYVFVYAAGDPNKPLRFRVPRAPRQRGLFLEGEIFTFPLQSRYMGAYMGFGGFTRTNGAVLYLGSDTYTAPTL